MRKTPVEDYLEEISITLPEEAYGRLSDAIYETNVEFDQEIESRVDENAKLRELVKEMRACLEDECKRCHEWGYTCDLEHQMRELGVSGDE